MAEPENTPAAILTTDQKRDTLRRALAFLDEAAGEGIYFTSLDDRHDPAEILCDLTNALGLDDWPPARAAFLEQIT